MYNNNNFLNTKTKDTFLSIKNTMNTITTPVEERRKAIFQQTKRKNDFQEKVTNMKNKLDKVSTSKEKKWNIYYYIFKFKYFCISKIK